MRCLLECGWRRRLSKSCSTRSAAESLDAHLVDRIGRGERVHTSEHLFSLQAAPVPNRVGHPIVSSSIKLTQLLDQGDGARVPESSGFDLSQQCGLLSRASILQKIYFQAPQVSFLCRLHDISRNGL